VEVDKNGELALLPEDRNGWDLLVGAVHYLPPEILNGSSRELQHRFLWACECLLKNEVDVLAHPFRFFRRHDLPIPKKLYKPLAQMLKNFRAAAELNFHGDEPDPDFFKICLKEGVKISLGTDSHNILETADFRAHLKFLEGLRVKNFRTVLWSPSQKLRTAKNHELEIR
jgi:histidinol phosphatase-like PHP family hydrolase